MRIFLGLRSGIMRVQSSSNFVHTGEDDYDCNDDSNTDPVDSCSTENTTLSASLHEHVTQAPNCPTNANLNKPIPIPVQMSMDIRDTRFTNYFSKIVKPRYVMEWSVKRSKLNKLVYSQTDKYLKCDYKLELDAGLGGCNPKAAICIHPYGREEDQNKYVTLEVRLETTNRSKCLTMHSDSKVVVKTGAEDEDGIVLGRYRKVEESSRFRYFYIKGFISHQDLKLSHSDYIHIMISCIFNNVNTD